MGYSAFMPEIFTRGPYFLHVVEVGFDNQVWAGEVHQVPAIGETIAIRTYIKPAQPVSPEPVLYRVERVEWRFNACIDTETQEPSMRETYHQGQPCVYVSRGR